MFFNKVIHEPGGDAKETYANDLENRIEEGFNEVESKIFDLVLQNGFTTQGINGGMAKAIYDKGASKVTVVGRVYQPSTASTSQVIFKLPQECIPKVTQTAIGLLGSTSIRYTINANSGEVYADRQISSATIEFCGFTIIV